MMVLMEEQAEELMAAQMVEQRIGETSDFPLLLLGEASVHVTDWVVGNGDRR